MDVQHSINFLAVTKDGQTLLFWSVKTIWIMTQYYNFPDWQSHPKHIYLEVNPVVLLQTKFA